MKKIATLAAVVLVASIFVVSCGKKDAPKKEEPTRIESTLNQTETNKVYVVKGQYWYKEGEDVVVMVCYDGNYNMKLKYPAEMKGIVKYLNEDDIYDITFKATKFSGEPTETEGELIAINVLPEEEE